MLSWPNFAGKNSPDHIPWESTPDSSIKQYACVIKHFTTYEQNECACSSQFLSANQAVVKKQAWEIILIILFKHLYLPFSDVWIRTFWISPMCSFNWKPPGCCRHLTRERKMSVQYYELTVCIHFTLSQSATYKATIITLLPQNFVLYFDLHLSPLRHSTIEMHLFLKIFLDKLDYWARTASSC